MTIDTFLLPDFDTIEELNTFSILLYIMNVQYIALHEI